MFDSFIIENVKRELGFQKIQFVKIDWVWSDTSSGKLIHSEKVNNIDGILIFNLSISQVGTGSTIKIIDDKRVNHIVFEGVDGVPGIMFLGNFVYFVPDNNLKFSCGIPALSYGFNYVTIRRDE